MANPGQPTLRQGATGPAVRRLQRALHRTGPGIPITIDGIFGPKTEDQVKLFQEGAGVVIDGIVGAATWAALPSGGAMPMLQQGSRGPVVSSLQQILDNGAGEYGGPSPGAVDGDFGPHTKAAVQGFQRWAGLTTDGEVGDMTWAASLHAAGATLESAVGLEYAAP